MFSSRIIKILPFFLLSFLGLWASVEGVDSASLHPTPTATSFLQEPGTSIHDITFQEMGFGEHTLHGPYAVISHEFVLPDGWQIQPNSYVELSMSYISNILLKSQEDERYAILDVSLDEHLLAQHLIQEPAGQLFRLRIALPPDLLNQSKQRRHDLTIRLDSSYICDMEHRYDLTVFPDSTFHFEYQELPAVPDLRIYPRPIYRGSLKRDSVLFVLPQHPNQAELSSAAAIAAKLGQSIGSQLTISTLTDISLTQELAANSHLFIVGTPDNNLIVSQLNADGLLPVNVKPVEAQLAVQGPERFPDNGVLSYTVAVTNNMTSTLNTPALELILPPETPPLACSPDCEVAESGFPHRFLPPLGAGQATLVTFTLTLSHYVSLPTVNTTVVLVEPQRDPLNAVTWSTIVTGSLSPANRDLPRHLFVYAGRAVPEVDGVIQEIVSPWNSAKVVMVVSGATAEGVTKASQALSTEAYFPGMSGQAALVREVEKVPPEKLTAKTDFILADLDYADETVHGFGPKEVEFWFYVPFGWILNDDAHAVIRFRHSASVRVRQATLTILVNDEPVYSVELDSSIEEQGILAVPLPPSQTHGGWNHLTFIANHEAFDVCIEDYWTPTIWLTILNTSEMHLSHHVATPKLDLGTFPLPYILTPDLSDLLFALPDAPGMVESLAMVRLAAALGSATDSDSFSPTAILGDPAKEAMAGKHVIAIGRPSVSPMIWRLNAVLPQPFIQGTDQPLQTVDTVAFRIPPGTEIGVIEQIPSIWDPAKAVLVVTGTSDEGLSWATNAVTNRWLEGNLDVVHGTQVHSVDTRQLSEEESVSTLNTLTPAPSTATPSPAMETVTPTLEVMATSTPLPPATETTTVAVSQTPSTWERTSFGLAITVTLLLTAVALGFVWWRKRRKRYW